MQKTVKLKYNYVKGGLSGTDGGSTADREFLIFLVLCVVLLCALTLCDVRYDFHIKTMPGSSLYLKLFVRGFISYIRYLCLIAHSDV
jgi:hypothetical protein